MAKKTSKRVMDVRKRNNDRVSFLIDKEGKYLLHAQAMREGVSVAEMLRRAVLARCGLESMPDFSQPHYQAIVTANSKESAEKAIKGLQLDEYVQRHQETKPADDVYMTVMLSSQTMKEEYINALMDLLDAVNDTAADGSPTKIKPNSADGMSGKEIVSIVQRLISNIMPENVLDDDSSF